MNWGITFTRNGEEDEAWVTAPYLFTRYKMGELDIDRIRDFTFLTYEGRWADMPSVHRVEGNLQPVDIPTLDWVINMLKPKNEDSFRMFMQAYKRDIPEPMKCYKYGNRSKIRLNFESLYNFLLKFPENIRERSRITLTSNFKVGVRAGYYKLETTRNKYGELVARLTNQDIERCKMIFGFEPPKEGYKVLDNNPRYPVDRIFGNGEIFEGMLDDNRGSFRDNIAYASTATLTRRLHEGTTAILHVSEKGYLLDGSTIQDVYNPEKHHGDCILRLPKSKQSFIEDGLIAHSPIMFSTEALLQVLNVYKGFKEVDFYLPSKTGQLALIVGVRENDSYPVVETALMTLINAIGDIG